MRVKGILFVQLLFSIILIKSLVFAQEWSDEIKLEQPGREMTIIPDFDIDPTTGHLHIVTMISPKGVLYTEMDADGNILQQHPIPHAVNDRHGNGNNFGATIAVDSQSRPHVSYREYFSGNPPKFSSYYTYYNGSTWISPTILSERVMRGWMLRMDISDNEKVHIARGSMANAAGEELVGPVKYFRFNNGSRESVTDNMYRYRADDRVELDASYENQVHIVLGCPDYPPQGGPVWYWRSFDNGETWTKSEIHDPRARGGNGSPDLFVDASGNVHIVYGSELDMDVNNKASVRYTRFENDNHMFDVTVTDPGEILHRFDTPYGIGSVAASADGEIVIIAYSEDFGKRLFVRESHDGGNSWGDPLEITNRSCAALGRNRQVIRAIKDHFFLLYPSPDGVKLRYKKFTINDPPVADAGGPYSGSEGSAINFDASGSSDSDGSITQYEWDYQNDGTYDATTAGPYSSYTYTDDFDGQLKLRITDNDGDVSTDVAQVTVNNVAPTANAGGPYSGEIDEVIQFTGTGTDPGNDELFYSWDLDDNGTFETTGQTAQKSYPSGGTYQVTLKATDDDGGFSTDVAQVSIHNYPPQIGNIPNQTIDEGGSFTPINLNDAVTDPDNTDAEITWTHSPATHLNLSIAPGILNVTVKDPEWNGTETITLTATDPGGKFDTADVSFTVIPVNDPPVIQPITVNPISEGEQFPPIALIATDPDNEPHEIQWTATGQQQLIINIQQGANPTASVTIPDTNWYGNEQVTFTATDPEDASDSKIAVFTVHNVNDPPVILPVLGQTIRYNQEFATVNLDTCVQDIDNTPDQIQWSFRGNNHLAINITNRSMTITRIDPDWTGMEAVTFTANDGQLSDSYTATFMVIYHNDPPKISNIFSQTINENGTFETLYLDDKADDPDHADNELVWTLSGYEELLVQEIGDRIFQIAVPDSEWAGTETILFQVTDPGDLSDSTYASFTVIPVNDPPKISNMTNFTFYEDTTYIITSTELKLMVTDPDNSFEELTFSLDNARFTKLEQEESTGNFILSAQENWFGIENVLFSVTDLLYAKTSQPITISVKPMPDPPMPFDLLIPFNNSAIVIRPETLEFSWRRSIDPDDEPVTYSWNLSKEIDFTHIIAQYNNIPDTTYTYTLPQHLEPGLYYWKVIAFDPTGFSTPSNNVNLFSFNFDIGVTDDPNSQTPKEFALYQNHPNPFNPETRIRYQLPQTCHVRLAVYNNVGQLIKTLVNEEQNTGSFSLYWNGTNDANAAVSSGIYIYKLHAGDFVMARKMLYLR